MSIFCRSSIVSSRSSSTSSRAFRSVSMDFGGGDEEEEGEEGLSVASWLFEPPQTPSSGVTVISQVEAAYSASEASQVGDQEEEEDGSVSKYF